MKWEKYVGQTVVAFLTSHQNDEGEWVQGLVEKYERRYINGRVEQNIFLLHNNPNWNGGNSNYNIPTEYRFNWLISGDEWCKEISLKGDVDRLGIQVSDSKLRFKFSL